MNKGPEYMGQPSQEAASPHLFLSQRASEMKVPTFCSSLPMILPYLVGKRSRLATVSVAAAVENARIFWYNLVFQGDAGARCRPCVGLVSPGEDTCIAGRYHPPHSA